MPKNSTMTIGSEPAKLLRLHATVRDGNGYPLADRSYYGAAAKERIAKDADRVRMNSGLRSVTVDIVETWVDNPGYKKTPRKKTAPVRPVGHTTAAPPREESPEELRNKVISNYRELHRQCDGDWIEMQRRAGSRVRY